MDSDKWKIYGVHSSYFSMKMYYSFIVSRLPFEFMMATLEIKQKLEMRAESKQIPIIITPENWCIADSTPVLRLMDSRLPKPVFYPTGITGGIVSLIEEYFDEWIPRAVVHYRWHYPENALFARKQIAEVTISKETVGANRDQMVQMVEERVNAWGTRVCEVLGVSEKQQRDDVEKELHQLLSGLEKHFTNNKFFLGNIPCVVDLSMMGMLAAHLVGDIGTRKMMEEKYPNIVRWTKKWDQPDTDFGRNEVFPVLDVTALPPVVTLILELMGGLFPAATLANSKALKEKQKSFVVNYNGQKFNFRTRVYPEKSRRMLSMWLSNFLSDKEKILYQGLLKKFGLSEAFGIDVHKANL